MINVKVGIVGGGVVGQATARSYLEHVSEVRVYDKLKERATHSLQDTLICDIVFVCLPTPQRPNSLQCNTGYVEEFCQSVRGRDTRLVLKSTVPIGFTAKMSSTYDLPWLVHSPEFLTARCATTDAQLPSRNVLGYPLPWRVVNPHPLRQLYQRRFPGIPLIECSSDESEAAKLILNSFFAVKVAYWNEVEQLAGQLGLDWGEVMSIIYLDGRVHTSHTQVPGPDGKYGFGGTCLPKDLANLAYTIMENDLQPTVTQAAYLRNYEDRKRAT